VVSTANLAQLAADLLICTLNLERIGFLDDSLLIPAAGARDRPEGGDGGGISTSLELFGRSDLDVVIIQQRSPVLKSHKDAFVASLTSWIRESQFKSALFLTGLDLSDRRDAQMGTPTYHLFHSSSQPQSHPEFDLSQIPPYKPSPTPSSLSGDQSNTGSDANTRVYLPGAGLTSRFLSSLSDPTVSSTTPLVILQYVLEGDNRLDAHLLARRVLQVLRLSKRDEMEIREPVSWKGLFGEAVVGTGESIFG